MPTAERERRRAEIEQEVNRRMLVNRDHKRIQGRPDAQFNVVVNMLLDKEDEIRDLEHRLNRLENRVRNGAW